LTIADVAYKVGFSSQAYFSTVFKSKFFCKPTEYKEKFKHTKQTTEEKKPNTDILKQPYKA
jgi:AraC-like DNA-binding protein